MIPDDFAKNEYQNYLIYQELEKKERVLSFKKILSDLAEHEFHDFQFWLKLSKKKNFRVSKWTIIAYGIARKLFGLTFTTKLLERREEKIIQEYQNFLPTATDDLKPKIQTMIEHEVAHESKLLSGIQEKRLKFLGNIVLGFNDGLIELTGALTGFSFILDQQIFIALAGLVTGIAATLSMASSAYLQAVHESGKDSLRSGIYTGVSYLIVTLLLILPFFIFNDRFLALLAMFLVAISLIVAISFYISVIFEKKFSHKFIQMLMFSLGVGFISAVIGTFLRWIIEEDG